MDGEIFKVGDMLLYREALASCAIEGNEYAKEMLELFEVDRVKFIERCRLLSPPEAKS